jgi:hypothetical protein
LAVAAAVAVVSAGGTDGPVAPVPFSNAVRGGPLAIGWSLFDFPSVERRTDYHLTTPDAGPVVLAAHSRDAAALLWSPVGGSLSGATTLRWRWRVDRTLDGSDLTAKRRDDAAARVYVGFAYRPELVGRWQRLRYRLAAVHFGEMPPYAAMVYTWAHAESVGSRFASPHLERAITVVLRNSDDPADEWVDETRDVRADFRDWFGFEPPPLSHVAVMTDTDDTHGEATAWYGDLVLD